MQEKKDNRIGNQFWKLRAKHGREKIFSSPELLREAAYEYFDYIESNPLEQEEIVKYKDCYQMVNVTKKRVFQIGGLCIFLGINIQYFDDFEESLKGKDDSISKDFSLIITHIREVIRLQKFEGAASGFFNPTIIARDLGLKDKTDITTNGEKITNSDDIKDLKAKIAKLSKALDSE